MWVCGLGLQGRVCVCVCVCVRICTSTCCHDRRKQQRRGSPSAQSDIKNNIPSLHVGSMSPQQGAHACMINGSMYVCWLHIPLMLVMWDIFQPLTKLSSLKIRGTVPTLVNANISAVTSVDSTAVMLPSSETTIGQLRLIQNPVSWESSPTAGKWISPLSQMCTLALS